MLHIFWTLMHVLHIYVKFRVEKSEHCLRNVYVRQSLLFTAQHGARDQLIIRMLLLSDF